jgi:adenosine 3'-phospho 5'-phosphosulfate transporter B3
MLNAVKLEKEEKLIGMQRRQQLRLLLLCVVIIFCHTCTSYLEETLFKHLDYKSPFFMVLVMCVLYSFFFALWKVLFAEDKRFLPERVFGKDGDRSLQMSLALLCVAYGTANSLTKLSLQFVSVPTQIVFKSCKLVAVMIGSTFILGKSYSTKEYLIALGLVVGMMSFALADMTGSASSSLTDTGPCATPALPPCPTPWHPNAPC